MLTADWWADKQNVSQHEAVTNASKLHAPHLDYFPMHTPDFFISHYDFCLHLAPLAAAATVNQLANILPLRVSLNHHAAMLQIRHFTASSDL